MLESWVDYGRVRKAHSRVAVDLHRRFDEDLATEADALEPAPRCAPSPLVHPTGRPEGLPAAGFQLIEQVYPRRAVHPAGFQNRHRLGARAAQRSSDGTFLCLATIHTDRLLSTWQIKIFELLVAAGKIDRQTVDQMRSWPHSGQSGTTASINHLRTRRGWNDWLNTSCGVRSVWPA